MFHLMYEYEKIVEPFFLYNRISNCEGGVINGVTA